MYLKSFSCTFVMKLLVEKTVVVKKITCMRFDMVLD